MNTKNILIGVGVIGVAIFIYTKMRKKKDSAIEPQVDAKKTLLTAEQVNEAIKEEPKKKEEVMATKEYKPQAPMLPMMPLEEKPVAQNQKLPPPITETKVVGDIKPKVVMEFESEKVKNEFQAPPRKMKLSDDDRTRILTSLSQQLTKQEASSMPKTKAMMQQVMPTLIKNAGIVGIPSPRSVVAPTPLTRFAPQTLNLD